jgi:hypothetical protein
MIKDVINILASDDFYGQSKRIDFAKGSHKIPYTWKQVKQLIKRMWHGRR